MEKNTHNICINSRNSIEISGVTDMGAYDEQEVEIDTTDGLLIICGTDLNVTKLDVESGVCCLVGRIDSLYYTDRNEKSNHGIFKRIFK